jgi:hypothetical protein
MMAVDPRPLPRGLVHLYHECWLFRQHYRQMDDEHEPELMAARRRTIVLSDHVWALAGVEAAKDGVTTSQFVRESLIARLFYRLGREGAVPNLDELVSELLRGRK